MSKDVPRSGRSFDGLFMTDLFEAAARAELREEIRQRLGSLSLDMLERIALLIDGTNGIQDTPEGVTSLDEWRQRNG